jgi:hypothetical protein
VILTVERPAVVETVGRGVLRLLDLVLIPHAQQRRASRTTAAVVLGGL